MLLVNKCRWTCLPGKLLFPAWPTRSAAWPAPSKADRIHDALEAWEARERPLTEHTQTWSRMYSATTRWPQWLRSAAFNATGQIGWLRNQYQKTANHIPTGVQADLV